VYICLGQVSIQPLMQNIQMAVTSMWIHFHMYAKEGNENTRVAFNIAYFKYANMLTDMPHCYIGICLLYFSKWCIKIFVKGVQGIPHLFTSHYQMNLLLLPRGMFIRITLQRMVMQDMENVTSFTWTAMVVLLGHTNFCWVGW